MRQQIAFILFFLTFQISLGQQVTPTKENVTELFKESYKSYEKVKGGFINRNPLTICNDDSSFYKSDTIKIYSNREFRYHFYYEPCCKSVDWSFTSKSTFKQSEKLICFDQSLTWLSVYLFKIKIKSIGGQLYLQTYYKRTFIDKYTFIDNFKIIGLENTDTRLANEKCMVLTLLRIKQ